MQFIHHILLCLFHLYQNGYVASFRESCWWQKSSIYADPNVASVMEPLAEKRDCCSIPTSNVYFFVTPSTNGFINGWQVMHNVALVAQVTHPKLIYTLHA